MAVQHKHYESVHINCLWYINLQNKDPSLFTRVTESSFTKHVHVISSTVPHNDKKDGGQYGAVCDEVLVRKEWYKQRQ